MDTTQSRILTMPPLEMPPHYWRNLAFDCYAMAIALTYVLMAIAG